MSVGYLLKARCGPLRMRDFPHKERAPLLSDPLYLVTADAWAPFRYLPESLETRHDDQEPHGDKELAVRRVDDIDEYEFQKPVNRKPKPKPPEPEPEPEAAPQPAKLSQTVDPEKLAEVMAETKKTAPAGKGNRNRKRGK